MDNPTKRERFGPLRDAEPLPPSLLTGATEESRTLAFLQELGHDFTPFIGRDELLHSVAERVKSLVDYHVFSVMLWNEDAQLLQTVFTLRYDESIPRRLNLRLHQGLTGSAAGQRQSVRVNDVLTDPRYIRSDTGVDARSELVLPLLRRD